jgi:hypothetical protein
VVPTPQFGAVVAPASTTPAPAPAFDLLGGFAPLADPAQPPSPALAFTGAASAVPTPAAPAPAVGVSPFLSWIGSPFLRHCVHGASIGRPAGGVCAASHRAAAQRRPRPAPRPGSGSGRVRLSRGDPMAVLCGGRFD